uniref:Protein C3orf33 (inferred by orthology to a human protein) n=1 Tax=Strongyloides venezuelensis TaxID=75913 RepID=A0A0K0FH65_STRVS
MSQNNEESNLVEPSSFVSNDKSFVDKHASIIVRGGIMTTGLLGLGIYLKTSPSFRRFKHVSQIPKIFYDKEITIKGIVKGITPTGKLIVEHLPLVKLSFVNSSKGITPINLNLAGIVLSDKGLNMITKDMNITNKQINFKVIKPTLGDKNCVDAEINIKRTPFTNINLSQLLVRKGFAKVLKPTDKDHVKALESNKSYSKLIDQLLLSEMVADKRGVGVWEKQSWVEGIQTTSKQTINSIKKSPLVEFGSFTGIILKDIGSAVFFILLVTYHTIAVSAIYTKETYNKLTKIITRTISRYNTLIKKQIEK